MFYSCAAVSAAAGAPYSRPSAVTKSARAILVFPFCENCSIIGGGRPKAFGVALERKLLGAFWYEGKNYEFNFSKFWTRSETEFDCHETADEIVWHVVQTTLAARLETDIRCKKRDMLLIRYESPAGEMRHEKLWNGGNGYGTLRLYERRGGEDVLIDEVAAESVGCEYGEYN